MNSKELFDKILSQITVYLDHEAREIVFWLIEHYLGLRKIDVLSGKTALLAPEEDFWSNIIKRINNNEPIQYIIGETDFYGRRFFVNPSVLIPRPETEELIVLTLKNIKNEENFSILDIGTGSGCIAITLAKELPHAQVTAYDVSVEALETARKNAELNQVNVDFVQKDFLSISSKSINQYDIIISNPPYIAQTETQQMRKNVLDFEPHLALFVEDNDPLVFYKAIARFAQKNLKKEGLVAVEINEAFGIETAEVFRKNGFKNVEIVKDIFQKERFVLATNLPV